jgi:hypothetical protein
MPSSTTSGTLVTAISSASGTPFVQDEKQLADTYAYIEANPREAGLCGWDEPWPWAWTDLIAAA